MTKTPTTADRFRLGAPQVRGPLTIHPVFGPRGRVRCRSLSAGIRRGVRVREVPGGRVDTVAVRNPTDLPVLLYEGELILGAAQNRTIDQPVLVPAGVTLELGHGFELAPGQLGSRSTTAPPSCCAPRSGPAGAGCPRPGWATCTPHAAGVRLCAAGRT